MKKILLIMFLAFSKINCGDRVINGIEDAQEDSRYKLFLDMEEDLKKDADKNCTNKLKKIISDNQKGLATTALAGASLMVHLTSPLPSFDYSTAVVSGQALGKLYKNNSATKMFSIFFVLACLLSLIDEYAIHPTTGQTSGLGHLLFMASLQSIANVLDRKD